MITHLYVRCLCMDLIVSIIRPRRSRSRQTFPWTICRSCTYVRRSVGLSSALWKNGGSDPDAVWHRRLDGSRDEVSSGVWGSVHGKGYFGGHLERAIGDFMAYVCGSAATRPSFQITLGRLVIIIIIIIITVVVVVVVVVESAFDYGECNHV